MVEMEANPEKIKKAELVVSIPSYKEADSISYPTQQASEGLEKYFPDKSAVIINCDNNSPDNTKQAFLETPTRVPKIYITTPEGVKGKGNNFKNLFQKVVDLKAGRSQSFDEARTGLMMVLAREQRDEALGQHVTQLWDEAQISFLDSDLEPAPSYDEPPSLERQETGGTGDGTSILRMDPEQHKDTRIVNVNELGTRRNPAEKAGLASRTGGVSSPDSQLDDFWGQIGLSVRRLRPLEKIALLTIVALILGAFLPWYTPKGRGSISGIEVSGWLTALLACGAMVTFWVRVSLRIVLLVLLQVGLIVGAALVAGFALMNPGTKSVSFGIYFTLLAGGAAAVLSLLAAVKT